MSKRVTAEELLLGAIENGREHLRRLAEHYDFECEGGPLRNCVDFMGAAACFEHLVGWSRRAADTIAALERDQARIHTLEKRLFKVAKVSDDLSRAIRYPPK